MADKCVSVCVKLMKMPAGAHAGRAIPDKKLHIVELNYTFQ